jgi:hypothetical protein
MRMVGTPSHAGMLQHLTNLQTLALDITTLPLSSVQRLPAILEALPKLKVLHLNNVRPLPFGTMAVMPRLTQASIGNASQDGGASPFATGALRNCRIVALVQRGSLPAPETVVCDGALAEVEHLYVFLDDPERQCKALNRLLVKSCTPKLRTLFIDVSVHVIAVVTLTLNLSDVSATFEDAHVAAFYPVRVHVSTLTPARRAAFRVTVSDASDGNSCVILPLLASRFGYDSRLGLGMVARWLRARKRSRRRP